jgi:hypothetical protein
MTAGLWGMKAPKLLTLTLNKHYGASENMERIWAMKNALFHKLRYLGYQIRAWFAVVEFPNHIHIVIDCDYIPHDSLSKHWRTLTGDSYIVDVRKINLPREGGSRVVGYVTKYLTKGADCPDLDRFDLKSFHIIGSWGLNLDAAPPFFCDCGASHSLVLLREDDIDAYMSWWESHSSRPPDAPPDAP